MSSRAPNIANRVSIGLRLAPEVYKAVAIIAAAEDRSIPAMIERLLKSHPAMAMREPIYITPTVTVVH